MKFYLIPIVFVCFVTGFQMPNAAGQALNKTKTEIKKSEFSEYASVYEFYLSNMLAWETGEFMVKVAKTKDSTNLRKKVGHLVFEETRIYRIKFDYPNKRFLCLVQEEFDPLLFVHDSIAEEDANKIGKRFSQFGFCCLEKEAFIRKFPATTTSLKQGDMTEKLSKRFKVPDFRTFGVLTESSSARFSQLEEITPRLASGYDIVEAENSAGGVLKFVRHRPIKSSNGEQYFVTTSEFDSKTMMPTLRKIEVSVLEDSKRKRVLDSSEMLKWRSIDGIHVPVSLNKEGKGTERFLGKRFFFDTTVDMEFKWISLNKDFEPEEFDPELLTDFGKLLKFEDVKDLEQTQGGSE